MQPADSGPQHEPTAAGRPPSGPCFGCLPDESLSTALSSVEVADPGRGAVAA